jgi:hypothetical protein
MTKKKYINKKKKKNINKKKIYIYNCKIGAGIFYLKMKAGYIALITIFSVAAVAGIVLAILYYGKNDENVTPTTPNPNPPLSPTPPQPRIFNLQTIEGPDGQKNGAFGENVVVLPNGNYVVTDTLYSDGPLRNLGAVYLFSGKDNELISSLKGENEDDKLGSDGIKVLATGDFVVVSSLWNGLLGAVTYGHQNDGFGEEEIKVSSSNSLVGTDPNDKVGSRGVVALSYPESGNYVVMSSEHDNQKGAVTLCIPTDVNLRTGQINQSNSYVGGKVGDQIGVGGIREVGVSPNFNFCITSRDFQGDNGLLTKSGAVTWASGNSRTNNVGVVSSLNSLVGSSTNDDVAFRTTVLSTGNYVVQSPLWNNPLTGIQIVGAITFVDGLTGIPKNETKKGSEISEDNSLIGEVLGDQLGTGFFNLNYQVLPLKNGKYVVGSPDFNNFKGIVILCDADGASGFASQQILRLEGSISLDGIGDFAIDLQNENSDFLLASPRWDGERGFVTFCKGDGSNFPTGGINQNNSLVGRSGQAPPDKISLIDRSIKADDAGLVSLPGGKYVVVSPFWDNEKGAVTVCAADGTTVGEVRTSNSLYGTTSGDFIGLNAQNKKGVTALSNGFYVVNSPNWNGFKGAVTWQEGTVGEGKEVSINNSLCGTTTTDKVGYGGVQSVGIQTSLNYVVVSPFWRSTNSTGEDGLGAVTWVDGSNGLPRNEFTRGIEIDLKNSLVGQTPSDRIGGLNGLSVLSEGSYVVNSYNWSTPNLVSNNFVGAVTFCNGQGNLGNVGYITKENSLIGQNLEDRVGLRVVGAGGNPQGIFALPSGGFYIISSEFDSQKGAVTLADTKEPLVGNPGVNNSYLSSAQGAFSDSASYSFPLAYNESDEKIIGGSPENNTVYIMFYT